MISEHRLQQALTYLAETDEPVAELKAQVARREYACKLARARQFLLAKGGSVEARKAEAEVSEPVQKAEEALADAIVAYEGPKAKRVTETLIVDVFRTIEASRRAGQL